MLSQADIDFKNLFGEVTPENLDSAMQNIFISPNKVAFVKKNIREGVIPKILHEFLCTRIMIKQSSKYVELITYFSLLSCIEYEYI